MSKLTEESFELLQDGLDALVEKHAEQVCMEDDDVRYEFEKSIEIAEEELIAIGIY